MHWRLNDVPCGDPRVASRTIGILGNWREQEEVRAVYPELSATLQVHRQEIRFYRGDAFDIPVQVQADDGCIPSNVSLEQSLLKFAAKLGVGHALGDPLRSIENEGAQVLKTSYVEAEIEFTERSNGRAIIHIRKADTIEHPLGDGYIWDLEVVKAVEHFDNPQGTVTVQAGSKVIMGLGTDFPEALGMGDIIHVQGRFVQVVKRDSESVLTTDFDGWTSEGGLTYNLYRGQSRTIAAGPWRCIGDVVV